MSETTLEVADIFRAYGEAYRKERGLSPQQEHVMRAIVQCRTAELGGHLYACDACGVITERFNSCRNRNCPKCQFLEKARWLEKRLAELLPVTYFHTVFTLPDHLLNPIAIRNEGLFYRLLFRAVADTLLTLGADPKHLGAKIGFLAVLHTWGQLLQLHPHIHAIVPGGGISPAGDRWISCGDDFFIHIIPLGRTMRGKFLDKLTQAVKSDQLLFPEEIDPKRSPARYQAWRDELYGTDWVTFAKPPFGGKEQGLAYLARYTHKIAISNHRLLRLEDDRVHFQYKDYADGSQQKETSLHALEFLRRYFMHVLPPRFHRIRYYGLLANRWRAVNLERCRVLLGVSLPETDEPDGDGDPEKSESWEDQLRRLTGVDPSLCPACKQGQLVHIEELPRQPQQTAEPEPVGRAPP